MAHPEQPLSERSADQTPFVPSPLPPELADFLKGQHLACLLHASDHGTLFVVKAPEHEIDSLRGRIPMHLRHELYQHPAAPVIRTVLTFYDQPERPLRLETFTNVGEADQRADFAALGAQDDLLVFLYDEQLRHRLSKRLRHTTKEVIVEVLRRAEQVLATIPEGEVDFDRAKADVVERTSL